MKRNGTKGLVLMLAASLWALAAGVVLQSQEPYSVDKKVPLPKTGQADLKLGAGPLVFEEIVIRNMPDDQDLEKAKSDPRDKCPPNSPSV